MASASFSLAFSISKGIVKKLLKITRSKLNSIESKISKALINNEISREDLRTIINEEENIDN